MANRKAEIAERQARLAAIQAAQRKSERRRTALIAGIVGAVILALVAATIYVVVRQNRLNDQLEGGPDFDVVEFQLGVEYDHSRERSDRLGLSARGGVSNDEVQGTNVTAIVLDVLSIDDLDDLADLADTGPSA